MGALVAGAVALFVAARNYYLYHLVERPIAFRVVFLAEAPVWAGWLILAPVVVYLARRFPPVGPRVLRHGALHVVAGLAASFIPLFAMIVVRSGLPDMPYPGPGDEGFWRQVWQSYVGSSLGFLFMYGAAVGLVLSWTYHREEQERKSRESALEAMLARAERDLLKMQIHPHFLFNTLNAISALLGEDPAGARKMVVRLSDLLRLSLVDDARHEVTLAEELEFLAHYVEIQKIRFGDRLIVTEEIHPETRGMVLPRLILQPLVENAIQHGIARREEGGRIHVTARPEDGRLVIEVSNDGPAPGVAASRGRGGVGLGNSRARLQQLYGSAASLSLEARPEGGAVVRLEIPAHDAAAAGSLDWRPASLDHMEDV